VSKGNPVKILEPEGWTEYYSFNFFFFFFRINKYNGDIEKEKGGGG